MEKIKLTVKPNKNIILSLLLLAGVTWSMLQILSAPPDPGHGWTDIGDSAGDALTAGRGGTGQTSLTADNVLVGNGANAIKFVAPGTTGNVLASNGSAWASSALTGLVTLLYSDETNSAVFNNSTTETNMKNWAMTVDPALYTYYLLESEVNANQGHDANANVTFTWNFFEEANLKRTIQQRGVGSAATGIDRGVQMVPTISVIIPNTSIPANANLRLTADAGTANTSIQMTAHSFRVYGIK